MGVKGITLGSKEDHVVGMLVVRREGTILVATEKGMGKRTDVIQYRTQTRGGKGVMTMRCTDKTGKMVNIMEVVDSDDLIIITDSGVLMRQRVADIRTIGRVTKGVKLDKVDDNGYVPFALSPALSSVTKSVEIAGCGIQNTLSVRKLDTGSIRVRNGDTLILTGVLQDSEAVNTSKVPILGDIPIFGSLFRNNATQKRKSELIILVTPKILKDR